MIANKGPWIAQHLFRPPRNELLGRRLGLAKFSTSRVPINAPKFRPHHRTGSLVQPICWRPRTPASVDLQLRYNSSVSNTTTSPSVISDNFATTPLEDAATLTAADITSLPERIGYLKELGLDYGWGPTSVIQWLLEHVHIWTGMPWWASILVTVTLLRAGTFKFTIDAADNGSRVQALKNVIQPIRERMSAASKSGDRDVAMQARAELQNIHARAGISTWKSFLPLINIPIGFGCFRLMRGMATLPVPGLETGGFLWVTDLTYGDPIYILPVVNGLLLFVTSKVAFSQAGGNIHPSLEKFMVYGLPGVTTLISLQWAACLQLSMIALAFWTSLFSGLLRSNRFRKWVGIVPAVMPEHTAGKNKGWVDQMKDGYQVAKSKAKVSQNSRGKQAELYEERRRREIEAEFERKRRR